MKQPNNITSMREQQEEVEEEEEEEVEEEDVEEDEYEEEMGDFDMTGALDRSTQSSMSGYSFGGGGRPSAESILALTGERSSELLAVRRAAEELNRQDLEAKKIAGAGGAGGAISNGPSTISTSSGGGGGGGGTVAISHSMATLPDHHHDSTSPPPPPSSHYSDKHEAASAGASSASMMVPTAPSSSVMKTDRVSLDQYSRVAATTSMGGAPPSSRYTSSSTVPPPPTSQPGAFRSGGVSGGGGTVAFRDSLTGDELIGEILQTRNSEAAAAAGQAEGSDGNDAVDAVDLEADGPSHHNDSRNPAVNPNQQQQQTPDDIMVEATLVGISDESQQQQLSSMAQPPPTETTAVFSEAHALDENEIADSFFRTKQGRRLAGCVGFIILVLVAGMTVAIVFIEIISKKETTTTSTTSTNPPPNHNNTPTMTSTYTQTTPSVFDELMFDPSGDENAIDARNWLQKDPNLEDLTPQEIKQRYVLMTLYYATQGSDWNHNDSWMEYRAEECSWYMTPSKTGTTTATSINSGSGAAVAIGGDDGGSLLLGQQLGTDRGELSLQQGLLARLGIRGMNDDESCNEESILHRINLDSNLLNGTIPPAVALLADDIRVISLANNTLQGGIPTALGALSNLQVLDLHDNYLLGGSLPTEFGSLSALRYLDVSRSGTTGPIPSQLSLNQDLMHLNLNDNFLDGSVPPGLFQLPYLQFLDLSDNNIMGDLPSELGLSSTLNELSLGDNYLSGNIPSELGELSLLDSLHLEHNILYGPIPSELGSMSGLSLLDVASNRIEYAIPSELGRLTDLCQVNVSMNRLTGTIPPEMGANCHGIPGIQPVNNTRSIFIRGILWVKANAINQTTGIMSAVNDTFTQNVMDEMKTYSYTLQSFNVEATDIIVRDRLIAIPVLISALFSLGTDFIPPARKELEDHFVSSRAEFPYSWREEGTDGEMRSETEVIYFTLQGSLPMVLDAGGNSISGTIPENLFGPGSMLQQLHLASNQILGSIPVSAGHSPELAIVDLSDNQISGAMPSDLGLLTKLATLDLSKNEVTGSIPLEIWKSRSLRRLDLSHNQISGSLPSLGAAIATLDLSHNRLSNAIPSELGLLHTVCNVDLSYNALSGTIPKELGKICLRAISEEHTTSVAVAHTLRFGFAPGYPVRMPTIDEIGAWLHVDADHYVEVLKKVFINFEKVDLVYVNGSLDETNNEFPLSFDVVVGVFYKPGSVIPDHDDYIDQPFDADSFEEYIHDFLIPINMDPFLGVRRMDFTLSEDPLETKPPVNLDLSYNQLTGNIPAELASLFALGSSVNLMGNNFTGSLPEELCPWHCALGRVGSVGDQREVSVLRVDCQQVSCQCDCS